MGDGMRIDNRLFAWILGLGLCTTATAAVAQQPTYRDYIIHVRPKPRTAPPTTPRPTTEDTLMTQRYWHPGNGLGTVWIWPYAFSSLPIHLDFDADGIPNVDDADRDGDGIPNHLDRSPNDWGRW